MPVARKRHTKARRDRARVFYKLKPKNLVECPNCKTQIEAHIVCSNCGQYKGKEVIDTTKKLARKAKKK
jgi:large subunit ribosomal protein L32